MMTDARFVKDADVEQTFFKHSGISSCFAVAKGQGQRRSIGQRAIIYPTLLLLSPCQSLQPPALGPAHSGSSTVAVTHSVSRLWELGAVRHSNYRLPHSVFKLYGKGAECWL
jgi:hypothetical protein